MKTNFSLLGRLTIVSLLTAFNPNFATAQTTYSDTLNCAGGTPTFVVDLSGNPDTSWVSDPAERDGSCCLPPDNNCVQFALTLDSSAIGINFFIPGGTGGCGASPSGSLFYQVDCGPLTSVGTPLCLDGPGPYIVTFCKPGANLNCYSIQSIAEPSASDGMVISEECTGEIAVVGLFDTTITWTSVAPGAMGDWDAYLACPTCDTTMVIPDAAAPPSIFYQVCGTSIGGCVVDPWCDTVEVQIVTNLSINITPLNPTICFGEPGVTLTANPTGGAAPYTYLWNTGETGNSIFVSSGGTYYVDVLDSTICMVATDTVVVTEYLVPITANAGSNITVCQSPIPTVSLNGIIGGATAGIWSGGSGIYDTDVTDLTLNYTPSATEIAAGIVELILTATDTGTCPGAADTVIINLPSFQTNLDSVVTNVDCFGNSTGVIDIVTTGGALPLTYLWGGGETTEDLSGLPVGTYDLTVTDTNGCVDSITAIVTEPPPITTAISGTDISCFGMANGTIDFTVGGGTAPYSYLWTTGATGEDLLELPAGSYTVSVTDLNGCLESDAITLTEPNPLILDVAVTDVSCPGLSDGEIETTVNGGTPGYTFNWSTGSTAPNISGLTVGLYNLTLYDANSCIINAVIGVNEPIDFDAGQDSTAAVCNESGNAVNLNAYLTATAAGVWNEITSSGQFNNTTGILDATGLAAGDYLFSYTIDQFTPCTDTIALFTVTIDPTPIVLFSANNPSGCAPLVVNFENLTVPEGAQCTWDFGDGSGAIDCGPVSHTYYFNGTYDVSLEVVSDQGCVGYLEVMDYVSIEESPEAAFTFKPDIPNVDDPSVNFYNDSYGASSYIWNFGDGSPNSIEEHPSHLYPDDPNVKYKITLIAANEIGCLDTAIKYVTIEDVIIFFVPNVFTPDGDQYNNEFKPVMTAGYDVYDYHLSIFNRWGELLFESYNADYGWDGTYGNNGLVQDGVYVWVMEFGETMSDKRHKRMGHVSILK
jgi:gliding motility-associated-like protein